MTKPSATSARPAVSATLLTRMDAYWRAANYLSVGQIYLLDNPLLRRRDRTSSTSISTG